MRFTNRSALSARERAERRNKLVRERLEREFGSSWYRKIERQYSAIERDELAREAAEHV